MSLHVRRSRWRKNSLKIKSANRSSKSSWRVGHEIPENAILFPISSSFKFKFQFVCLFSALWRTTCPKELDFSWLSSVCSQSPKKRNYVPGLFKSHLPWWLLSSSAGMHVLDWDELTNESQCNDCLTHRDSHVRKPTMWHDVSPHPWVRIAADLCYFNFSNFIEVDSLSTKNFKAVILNLNFNFNSNGHV